MNSNPKQSWRDLCVELGLDPREIKVVSERYDMYSSYTDEQGGNALPLNHWYKWYRIEKLSEGHAMRTPPESDCSVSPDVHQSGNVVGEQDFLQLLQSYRTSRASST